MDAPSVHCRAPGAPWLQLLVCAAGALAQQVVPALAEFQCPSEADGCPCAAGCLEEIGDDICTCRSITAQSPCYSNISELFCPPPPCAVEACRVCAGGVADEAECAECNDGHLKLDGQCLSPSEAFFETAVHVKGNLVLVGDGRALNMLEACFAGADCFPAVEYVARAFLHNFEDVFDGIVVFPWKRLPGGVPAAHYWSGVTLREASGHLSSLLVLQNLGPSDVSAAPSFLNEVCQKWGTTSLDFMEDQLDPPGSWGMTVLDRGGALGGFPPGSVRCQHGTFPDCDSNQAIWTFGHTDKFNADGGAFSKFELLLMGLHSAAELDELPPLVHCSGPSQTSGVGETAVTCNSLVVLNATGVEASMSSAARAEQIAPGEQLHMAALVVFPSAADADAEAANAAWAPGSDLEWLSGWVESSAALFGPATEGLADLSFFVTDDQRRQEMNESNASDFEAPTTTPSDWMAAVPAPDENTVQVLMTIQNVDFQWLSTNASLFHDFHHAVVVAIARTGGVSEESVSLVLFSGSVRVAAAILTESRESATGVASQLSAPTAQLDHVVVVAVEDVLDGVREVSYGAISVTGLTVVTVGAEEDHDTSSAGALRKPARWALVQLALSGVCALGGRPWWPGSR